MDERSPRTLNIVGAFALGLGDRIRRATQGKALLAGETSAALSAIGHSPGLSIDQLRHIVGLSHPGTVRLLERLNNLGLIRKIPGKADKRVVTIQLTEAGVRERQIMLQRRQTAIANVLQVLDGDELCMLERLAEKMAKTFCGDVTTSLNVCRLCDNGVCSDCPMNVFGALIVPEPEA